MTLEYHFICPLPNGIHARPASAIEEVARGFESEILLTNERLNHTANGKSVLSVIGADIRLNDACVLTVSGRDGQQAMSSLSTFLRDKFPHCDEPAHASPAPDHVFQVPPRLQNTAAFHPGTPVVPGIGRGHLVQAGQFVIPPGLSLNGITDVLAESGKMENALAQLVNWYDHQTDNLKNKIERDIIGAQRSMARDPEFRNVLLKALRERSRSCAGAVADAEAHFSALLVASGNALLRERILDVQGACAQLLRIIYGEAALPPEVQLAADSIIVARSLRPDQFLAMDRRHLKGLVLSDGGTTSHTVILARSFGIPTITGVNFRPVGTGHEAILDAELGALVTDLNDSAWRYYASEQSRLADRRERLGKFSKHAAVTHDGHRVELGANIATADEAVMAFDSGAEGIGLFRTEMLFLERDSPPGENEQFEIYGRVLKAAGDRPVIVRTLDVGGDKVPGYLNLPAEENPFLGYRAVRIYPEFQALFRTQIRALVRASAQGRLKIMVPMIATVEEARWVKTIIADEQSRYAAENIPFDQAMLIGGMIEVPAAAFAMDALCHELDFFSIGSNDLLQYFMAVDRTNARVAGLYNPLEPAFWRLLKHIVAAAHTHKKWIGLCGEMGGQKKLLPLLVGLGLDEISCAAPVIPDLKPELATLVLPDCQRLLAAMLKCASMDEALKVLEKSSVRRQLPLMDPELVLVDVPAGSKEEAIKVAIDRLYVLGRIENAHAVEAAVWQREKTYSTGFGHGFAIPHCKTPAVQTSSLVLLKLREPVAWGSLDGELVRVVILLVMCEADANGEHMKIFSKLARQIMHEKFRDHLEQENDPAALCEFLTSATQRTKVADKKAGQPV